jgi:hypothetical protein
MKRKKNIRTYKHGRVRENRGIEKWQEDNNRQKSEQKQATKNTKKTSRSTGKQGKTVP